MPSPSSADSMMGASVIAGRRVGGSTHTVTVNVDLHLMDHSPSSLSSHLSTLLAL